jgi:phosphatidylethanolamine-binding protein (PEBP) family uncharacterized protein
VLDADVPSREQALGRSFLHWLVTNISETDLEQGNTLKEYKGPRASKDTGNYFFKLSIF